MSAADRAALAAVDLKQLSEQPIAIVTHDAPPTNMPLEIIDLDNVIKKHEAFRPTLATPEFIMPAWVRVLFLLIVESGDINLADLATRAAMRKNVIREQLVAGAPNQHWGGRTAQRKVVRHILYCAADSRANPREIKCFLRTDTRHLLNNRHILFAEHWVHMNPRTYLKVAPTILRGTKTHTLPPPELRTVEHDAGQAIIAENATECEWKSPPLTFGEIVALTNPPVIPVPANEPSPFLNLTVCTDSACSVCYAGEEIPRSIRTPVPLFEPLDFLCQEWRSEREWDMVLC